MKDDNVYKQAKRQFGKVEFPLVSIYRPGGFSRSDFNTTFHNLGLYIVSTNTGKNFSFRVVNVDLEYTVEIASRTREDLEKLTAELILFFTQRPNLEMKLYMTNDVSDGYVESKFPVRYVSGPEDVSFLEEEETGILYRYVFRLSVDRAWLYNAKTKFAGALGDSSASNVELIEVVEANISNRVDFEKPIINLPEQPLIVNVNQEIELLDYISSEDSVDGDISSSLKFYSNSDVSFITPTKIKVGSEPTQIKIIIESVNSNMVSTMAVLQITVIEEVIEE